jgi:fatty acid desaturase
MNSSLDLKKIIPRSEIKKFSTVSSWRSVLLMLSLHFMIWLLAFSAQKFDLWWCYLLIIILISGLQHHLLTLMHEGAHYLVHPKLKWNDSLTQALCAFPLGSQLKDYRYIHLQHHRYSGDPELDPEVSFYRKTQIGYGDQKKSFLSVILGDISGKYTLKSVLFFQKFGQKKVQEGKIRKLKSSDFIYGVLGILFMISTPLLLGFLKIYIFLWIISFLTLTPWLVRWHSIGEHTGINEPFEQDKTLTHELPFLVNFFLYPIRSYLHLEHHLFPQIPWYQISSFRKTLLKNPTYQRESHKLWVDGLFFGKKTVRQLIFNSPH